MVFIGKVIYFLSYPAIRLIIRNSHRVYGAIIFNDQILVTKNWLGRQNDWRLPGGGLKKSEPEIEGLNREIKEEVGIELSKVKWKPIIKNHKHKKNFYYSVYSCNIDSMPNIKINKKELLDAKFIDLKTINNGHSVSESLQNAVKLLMDD